MNKVFIFPLIATFICSSCSTESTDGNTKNVSDQKNATAADRSISLPDDPCKLISKEMVTTHFDVSADSLEKDEYNREGLHWTEHCTYKWKKKNFEEINKKNQERMLASMQKGSVKDAINTGKSIEQPNKHMGITNLRKFESLKEAQRYFKNSHQKPSEEDMKKLDKEFDKQSDEQGLSEEQKETGKSLAGGIADGIKFQDVDGIGDMASWDELGSKLDVLVGSIQFGVKVHTGNGTEADIQKAKAVAQDIMKNF